MRTLVGYFVFFIYLLTEIKGSPSFHGSYSDEKHSPNFLTLHQNFSFPVNTTVVLPCKVNIPVDREFNFLSWKRENAVLTAGNLKVTMDPRVRIIPLDELRGNNMIMNGVDNIDNVFTSYNLELRDLKDSDAAEYTCQIGSIVPKELVHNLKVLVPPKIDNVSPTGGRVDVTRGSLVRLECSAKGNPPPRITWTRKNNLMPNGAANVTSNVYEIDQTDRHSAGHYVCTAENHVGFTDSKEIFVNVRFPPEIEGVDPFIHTGIGFEAKLTCIVHSEPPASVVWLRNSRQLDTNSKQYSSQRRGNAHSILIRNVTSSDMGNYTCQGTNSLGSDSGFLILSGIPSTCSFDSNAISDFKDRYNISWSVESYSPIREYRLFYRKQSSKSFMTTHRAQQPHHEKNENTFTENNYQYPIPTASVGLLDQWENVVIPDFPEHYPRNPTTFNVDNFVFNGHISIHHHMSFLIKNLSPSTDYEARVQARNDHGWNKLSNVFHFSSNSEDIETDAIRIPTVLRSAGLLDAVWMNSGSAATHFSRAVKLISMASTFAVFISYITLELE